MAQTVAELEKQLAEVQAAISSILTGGQSMGASNRHLTRADLRTLQDREKMLLRRINAAASTHAMNRTVAAL